MFIHIKWPCPLSLFLFLSPFLPRFGALAQPSTAPVTPPQMEFHLGHSGAISFSAFSPDGKVAATAGADMVIKLWDTKSHELLRSLPVPGDALNNVAFSPDSATIASASSNRDDGPPSSSQVILWDVASGRNRMRLGSDDAGDIEYSPNGDVVAVIKRLPSGDSSMVDLFDAHTGRLTATIAQPGWATIVRFSPDGDTIAISSFQVRHRDGRLNQRATENTIDLWDVKSATHTRFLKFKHPFVQTLRYSPDGKLLAAACSDDNQTGSVMVWDAHTGKQLTELAYKNMFAYSMAFSPDSKLLASTNVDAGGEPNATGSAFRSVSGVAIIWDISTGSPLHVLVNTGDYSPVEFSPDGKTMATSGFDVQDAPYGKYMCRTSLWSVATGKRLHEVFSDASYSGIARIAFSRDGKTLLFGDTLGTVRWYNAHTFEVISEAMCAQHIERKLAFSTDGRTLASVGYQHGRTLLWNTASGRLSGQLETPDPTNASIDLSYSRDGASLDIAHTNQFPAGGTSSIAQWELTTGKVSVIKPEPAQNAGNARRRVEHWNALVRSPIDSSLLIVGGSGRPAESTGADKARIALAATLRSDSGADHSYPVDNVMDGISWWRNGHRLPIKPDAPTGEVFALTVSRDGKILATGGQYETVLWQAETGHQILRLHTRFEGGAPAEPYRLAAIRSLAFSPDGKLLASGDNGAVRIYKVANGEEVTALINHTGAVRAIEFSPDGSRLATAGDDGNVWISTIFGDSSVRLKHEGPVTSVAWSPDGRSLASACVDGGIRIWMPDGKLLITLRGFYGDKPDQTWIAYTPDGYYDASADIGSILRWRSDGITYSAEKFKKSMHRRDLVRKTLAQASPTTP